MAQKLFEEEGSDLLSVHKLFFFSTYWPLIITGEGEKYGNFDRERNRRAQRQELSTTRAQCLVLSDPICAALARPANRRLCSGMKNKFKIQNYCKNIYFIVLEGFWIRPDLLFDWEWNPIKENSASIMRLPAF